MWIIHKACERVVKSSIIARRSEFFGGEMNFQPATGNLAAIHFPIKKILQTSFEGLIVVESFRCFPAQSNSLFTIIRRPFLQFRSLILIRQQ